MKAMSKTFEVTKQELSNTLLAETVLKNAYKIGNKLVAEVPISLLRVDYTYQRENNNFVKRLYDMWDIEKCEALIVSYRKDGYFYIINGGHRFKVAQMKGITHLVCEIHTGLTLKDEAKMYTEQFTSPIKGSTYDIFKANLVWSNDVDTQIKEVCDTYKVTINRAKKSKNLNSITSARRIVKDGGKDALVWIFDIIKSSDWEDFSFSYGANVLEGLYNVMKDCSGNLAVAEDNLIKSLKRLNPLKFETEANRRFSNITSRKTRVKNMLEYFANGNDNVNYVTV